MNPLTITRKVSADMVLPLRQSVLRSGQPRESARFDGDSRADTAHFACFEGERIVGVGSVLRERRPDSPVDSTDEWRIRGMAVAPTDQGKGIGREIALACLHYVESQGGRLIWCNARSHAVEFYRRLEFEVEGGEFEIPAIGPHLRMIRFLN